MFITRKKRFMEVHEIFQAMPDTHAISDRKSIEVGTKIIYFKANINKIQLGTPAIIPGYYVIEKIQEPHSRDGYIVCCR